jgi:hypothetical protein
VFPMTDRVRVAHLLCARADAQLVAAPEEDALP